MRFARSHSLRPPTRTRNPSSQKESTRNTFVDAAVTEALSHETSDECRGRQIAAVLQLAAHNMFLVPNIRQVSLERLAWCTSDSCEKREEHKPVE